YFFTEIKQKKPVVVGLTLDADLGSKTAIVVQAGLNKTELTRVGTVDGRGPAASLGGNVLILDLKYAVKVLGMHADKVSRIDVTIDPKANREHLRQELLRVLGGSSRRCATPCR